LKPVFCAAIHCSPDLNPVETMWSKSKQILRSINAGTQEALLAAIAAVL
jgi:transposase